MSEARNPLAARAPRILTAHARAGESAQGAWALLVCTVVIPVDLRPFTLPGPKDHSPTPTPTARPDFGAPVGSVDLNRPLARRRASIAVACVWIVPPVADCRALERSDCALSGTLCTSYTLYTSCTL